MAAVTEQTTRSCICGGRSRNGICLTSHPNFAVLIGNLVTPAIITFALVDKLPTGILSCIRFELAMLLFDNAEEVFNRAVAAVNGALPLQHSSHAKNGFAWVFSESRCGLGC
ncbi:hypothetical protein D9M71_821640 [compost metagenome]